MASLPSPFAQVFKVSSDNFPDGSYIHSVDVAFAFKDDSLPITVQIRPVVDGYPSPSAVYHNAQATLFPDDIYVCDGANVIPDFGNATTYTRFVFDSPIYLPPGDHALVFQTASTQYFLFMAKIQDPLVGSTRAFSAPSYVGNLFRSQNSDAWAPYLSQCLMFRLNRCVFNTTTPSTVEFDVVAPLSSANVNMDVLNLSVNDVSFGKTGIEYSFKSTDSSTGSLSSTALALPTNQNYYPDSRMVLTTANASFKAYATMESISDFVSPMLDPTRINLVGVENIINDAGLQNNLVQITNAGAYAFSDGNGTVTFTISSPDRAGGTQAVASGTVTGNVLTNVVFSQVGSGYYGSVTMTADVPSPTPTTNATVSITTETGTIGGNFLARYITRKVVLNDGFDARDLQVYLTANRPLNTDIQVYYKVLSASDPDQDFSKKSWSRMVLSGNRNVYAQNSTDTNEFKFISNAASQIPPQNITYTNSAGTFTTFKTFAIKICLCSSSTTTVPWVKDLRGVACA